MDADSHRWGGEDPENTRFLFKEETGRIIGFAFEVLNELGHGLFEKIYENALTVEFRLNGILYSQQQKFDVFYKKHPVGFYVPDLIVFDQIIVDCKTIEQITDEERGKMVIYLKITGLRVGLILNFKHPRLEFERMAR